MSGGGGLSLSNLVGPALIATAISLLFNFWAEKRKAERDFVTKLFDGSREDITKAVEAAMEYFPLEGDKRTPLLEAKIWMSERDVRQSLASLCILCTQMNTKEHLERALDDFIDALTGGSFQNLRATADLEQARKIAAHGANLRVALAAARQSDLQVDIARDPLSRAFSYFKRARRETWPAIRKYWRDFHENAKNGDKCG